MAQLYIISPPQIELDNFLPRLEIALERHKPASFQLRLKEASSAEILTAAAKIIPICHKHNVLFILNDSAELARECGADGVHLGEESDEYARARRILGAKAHIGISCYADVARALEFAKKGADLVSFGQFHPTKTKAAKGWATTETIREFLELISALHLTSPRERGEEQQAPLPQAGGDGGGKKKFTYDKTKIALAKKLRNNSTEPEKILWSGLRAKQLLGIKFRRQEPIDPYIVDFVSHEIKLVIELDGETHATQQSYDAARTNFLQSNGYSVLRFWNNEVMQNIDGVLETIIEYINLPPSNSPRKRWEDRNVRIAAIGGINFENKAPIEAAGADYICMVSAIWDEIHSIT